MSPLAVCSHCQSPLQPGLAFCTVCGTRVTAQTPAPVSPPAAEPVFLDHNSCPRCQAPLKPGAAFCTSCGHTLSAPAPASGASGRVSPPVLPGGEANPLNFLLRQSERWWDVTAICGGLVAGGIWFFYALLRASREGPDFITPVLLAAMPVGIVLLRKPVDMFLALFNPIRQQIPRVVLIGAGLAAPYAVAAFMYKNPLLERWVFFGVPLDQFEYARRAMFVGTIVSYLILRTPATPGLRPAASGSGMFLPLLMLLFWLGTGSPLLADDFLADPLNLRDGLRTPGWAPVLAGTGAVAVSVLINGSEVIRTLVQPSGEGTGRKNPDEPQEETPVYTLDVRTQNQRTRLATDGQDELWIYAQVLCNKPNVDVGRLTQGVSFLAAGPNGAWLQIGSASMSGAFKAVPVKARPPSAGAVPAEGGAIVQVSADLAGRRFTAAVQLELEDELRMEFV